MDGGGACLNPAVSTTYKKLADFGLCGILLRSEDQGLRGLKLFKDKVIPDEFCVLRVYDGTALKVILVFYE